ncbi:MAG: hypothetical protein ACAI34_05675 [Verrucomicrobium sp.]
MSSSEIKIPATDALNHLGSQLAELRRIRKDQPNQGPLQLWMAKTRNFIGRIYGNASSQMFGFDIIKYDRNFPVRLGATDLANPVKVYIDEVEPFIVALIHDIEVFETHGLVSGSPGPPSQLITLPQSIEAAVTQSKPLIRVKKSQAVQLLRQQSELAKDVDSMRSDGALRRWTATSRAFVDQIFGENSRQFKDFTGFKYFREFVRDGRHATLDDPEAYYLKGARAILDSFVDEVENFASDPITLRDLGLRSQEPAKEVLAKIYDSFGDVVRVLKNRRLGHPSFEVKDEYDVQDLLHGLLLANFKVVVPEEPCSKVGPDYSILDFILPNQRIGIEVKTMDGTLTARKLKRALSKDLIDFSRHDGIDTLHIFIWDPGGKIVARPAFEHGFSTIRMDLKVECFIR